LTWEWTDMLKKIAQVHGSRVSGWNTKMNMEAVAQISQSI